MRDAKGRFIKPPPRASVPPVRYVAAPTLRNTWPLWVWLGLTAALWHFAGPALLVVAGVVFFLIGWGAFAARYPRTAWAITGFMRGLLGGRR